MKSNYHKFAGIRLHYYSSDRIDPDKLSLVFLHGFTGEAADWFFLLDKLSNSYNLIALDLPGHGKSIEFSDNSSFKAESMCSQLAAVLSSKSINRAVFIGYSMGGRLALSFAVNFPLKVKGLFLESTTAGIESELERIKRYKNDLQLAKNIEEFGVENFIKYWFDIPLFKSMQNIPSKQLENIIHKRKQNSAQGLINSLKEFSQGVMPNLWEELNNIQIPVQLISGNLDEKFCQINSEMNFKLPNSKHTIIEEAGHNTHLEKPEEFIILLFTFLRTLNS